MVKPRPKPRGLTRRRPDTADSSTEHRALRILAPRPPTQVAQSPIQELQALDLTGGLRSSFGTTTTVRCSATDDPGNTRVFHVHKDLLVTHSPFFSGALTGSFRESEENSVPLLLTHPDLFEVYLQWLYRSKIFIPTKATDVFDTLFEAYAMGDMLLDGDFKDALVDAVITRSLSTEKYPVHLVRKVYASTVPWSPARRLLVDMVAFDGDATWLCSEQAHNLTEDALLDIAVALLHQKTAEFSDLAPYRMGRCSYHEHTIHGGVCYKLDRAL